MHELNTEHPCPCGSQLSFAACCQPYIAGIDIAPSAEQLMRSRYTAFAMGAVDYLVDTLAPERRSPNEARMLAKELRHTQWLKLDIIDTAQGKPDDTTGQVEFKAHFESSDGRQGILHERSNFRTEMGRWVYVDGDVKVLQNPKPAD